MKKLILFTTFLLSVLFQAQSMKDNLKTKCKDFSELSMDDIEWIKITDDKFENRSFVEFKNAYYNRPYLSIKDGLMNMRFIWKYQGEEWIFFDKIILLSNGKKIEINNLEPERDVSIGYVTETVDISGTKEIYNFLNNAFLTNSDIDIRFQGKKVYDSKFKNSDIFKKIESIRLFKKSNNVYISDKDNGTLKRWLKITQECIEKMAVLPFK